MVFDALAGTYRVYLSNAGAAESQDLTLSSTTRINSGFVGARVGMSAAGNQPFNGWVDAFRLIRCATNTSTETPSASAPTITDYPVHFFSVPEMKMYEVTGASTSGGTNPTMTARTRVFVGECDTNGSSVTAARNYALRGEAFVTLAGVGASTGFTITHNLGVPREFQIPTLLAQGALDSRYIPWSTVSAVTTGADVYYFPLESEASQFSGRNNFQGMTGANGIVVNGIASISNYIFGLLVKRSW